MGALSTAEGALVRTTRSRSSRYGARCTASTSSTVALRKAVISSICGTARLQVMKHRRCAREVRQISGKWIREF